MKEPKVQFVASTSAETVFQCLFLLSAYRERVCRSASVRRCQLCACTVRGAEGRRKDSCSRTFQFSLSSKHSIKAINWFPSDSWDGAAEWGKVC